ncbi:hypothetical protein ABBQ32_004608 [Trebouxia sp. C0010 RCD-2024]
MSFWGTEVKPDKVVPFVPPPQDARLHISQACLTEGAGAGAKSALKVKVQDGPELYVCRLQEGRQDFANLDLVLDEYTEFTVEGAVLHITGYLMPEEQQMEEEEDEDEEMDEEYTPEMAQELIRRGLILNGTEDYDSEGSDSEEDGDFEGAANGIYDEDSDDDEESDDSDEADGFTHRSSVIIEEVHDVEHDGIHITSATAAKVEDPAPDEPDLAAQSSKKRKADTLKDAPLAAPSHPSKKQAKVASSQKPTSSNPTAASTPNTAKQQQQQQQQQQQPKHKSDKSVAEGAAAGSKKAERAASAAVSDADGTSLSKSQLKKQRKKAQGNEEAAASADAPVQAAPLSSESAPKKGSIQKWENGFQLERLAMGKPDGKLAKPGKKVVVRYRGSLQNGKVFDETKGNKTFSFRLGVGEVIKGWDRGVAGMRVGDKRKLTVPPQMGYGSDGVKGAIPPNATLLFNVELIDVK